MSLKYSKYPGKYIPVFKLSKKMYPSNCITDFVEKSFLNIYLWISISNSCKSTERAQEINKWYIEGGVLILGYAAFRILMNNIEDDNPSMEDKILKENLINPGPDLVVCDEGHLLKNDKTSLSDVMSNIRTLKRIALTGTPLQNNLKEYFCMINFVKPHLLGTMKEFRNRFMNPIENGQYINSTEDDIALMTRRSYVLHKLLDGSIQRVGLSVLEKFLPPKHEYVIYVRLTSWQAALYKVC